ncbi:GPP34 family phosphoprotein, partial [Streptomyces sp. NPDC127118]
MTTAKDLFIIAMDLKHSVGQGDLSLALAGAELIDLIGAGAGGGGGGPHVAGGPPPPGARVVGVGGGGGTTQAP